MTGSFERQGSKPCRSKRYHYFLNGYAFFYEGELESETFSGDDIERERGFRWSRSNGG